MDETRLATRIPQQRAAATAAALLIAIAMLAACSSPFPAAIPPGRPPDPKWVIPVAEAKDLDKPGMMDTHGQGVTLAIHGVLQSNGRVTVFFSTAISRTQETAVVTGASRQLPVALPEVAHLGMEGRAGGPKANPPGRIVELARLGGVLVGAMTFEFPEDDPPMLFLEVSQMQQRTGDQVVEGPQGLWRIPLLRNYLPGKPNPFSGGTSFTLMKTFGMDYGEVKVRGGEGNGPTDADAYQNGQWVPPEGAPIEFANLFAYTIIAGDERVTVYGVQRNDGTIEIVPKDVYLKWREPFQPWYTPPPLRPYQGPPIPLPEVTATRRVVPVTTGTPTP